MKKAMTKLAVIAGLLLSGTVLGATGAQAQVNDQRINQLQEQVRDLTGKLEEINFQILQMQEQMRKIQEDNEFRFQELEKQKKADAGSDSSTKTAAADSAAAASAKEARLGSADNADKDISDFEEAAIAETAPAANSVATGQQNPVTVASQAPRALGSIRFDASGNVIGGSLNEDAVQQQVVASLPKTDNPNELYQAAYQYILSGDYRVAEVAFRQHIERYPADPMTADARYWLGEALFGQARYAEAATVFIDMQRDFPDSRRGPENMLKLGMAMAKLNDREVACVTLAKIGSRYPNAAPAVLKRADEERKLNHC